jgi:protein SCO1
MLRLLSIVAALAVAGLLWFAIAQPLQVLPRGEPLPPVALTADDGRLLRPADLRGRPALISVGAARCGAPCAPSEALLRDLAARLAAAGGSQRVTLLTISVDPADTPERLQAQARRTPGRRWLGGPPDTLKALVGGELGIYYRHGPAGLELDATVILLDAEGLRRARYDGARLDLARVERDLALLEAERGASGPARVAYEASHLFLCYVD